MICGLFIARIKDLEKSPNSKEEKFKNDKSKEWSEVRYRHEGLLETPKDRGIKDQNQNFR